MLKNVLFFRLVLLVMGMAFIVLPFVGMTVGQEKKAEKSADSTQEQDATDKLATLRGKVKLAEKWQKALKVEELQLQLTENIVMEDPPIPENWNELAPEAQQKWWDTFEASDAGKKFIAAQEERFRNRRQFDVRVGIDGEFSVFDVPTGIWDLRGSIRKETQPYEMLFEVYGELEIEDAVDEIKLGEMAVRATPLFKEGDAAPPLEFSTDSGTAKLESFRGKHVLLTFWSAGLPTSSFFQKNLQAATKAVGAKHPMQLVSIGMDQDIEAAKAFLNENGSVGVYAETTLDGEIVEELGVRAIPWLMLIGPDGKIMMSDQALGMALRTSGLELAEIVTRKIEGREIPAPPAQPAAAGGQQD